MKKGINNPYFVKCVRKVHCTMYQNTVTVAWLATPDGQYLVKFSAIFNYNAVFLKYRGGQIV